MASLITSLVAFIANKLYMEASSIKSIQSIQVIIAFLDKKTYSLYS